MPADSYYEDLNERLASEQHCLTDNEADQPEESTEEAQVLDAARELGILHDREIAAAIEQEQILEASRSVRAGVDMLWAAMRKTKAMP